MTRAADRSPSPLQFGITHCVAWLSSHQIGCQLEHNTWVSYNVLQSTSSDSSTSGCTRSGCTLCLLLATEMLLSSACRSPMPNGDSHHAAPGLSTVCRSCCQTLATTWHLPPGWQIYSFAWFWPWSLCSSCSDLQHSSRPAFSLVSGPSLDLELLPL